MYKLVQNLFKKSLFTKLNMYRLIYTGGTIIFYRHSHSIKNLPDTTNPTESHAGLQIVGSGWSGE